MDSIVLKDVSKSYGDFRLRDVGFRLPEGSIMGLIGENGAGKTTTIKLILNMIKRDAGSIRLFGLDNVENEQEVKERIGVVLDEGGFHETFRLKDASKVMRNIYRTWDDGLFKGLCGRLELPQGKRFKEFSRGMKVKLSIAMALSHRPQLLILDEPTSGLDPVVRSEILDLFLDFIQDETHSILLSTHITTDLEKIADYVTFIHRGGIVLSEPKDELLEKYGVLRCGADEFQSIDKQDVVGYRKSAFGYEVLTADRQAAARKYDGMVVDSASLEDIMVFYVKGERG